MIRAWGLLVTFLLAAGITRAASDTAPLGSPDFYPSPAHPVGWRGDGSGRFPGATPPTVWNRRLADITSEIMVQTAKPNGKPGANSYALNYFTLKDWLVAGPFPAADPEKDIDNDFLGGEADVQPDAGAKAGDSTWKVHRASEGSQSYHNFNEMTCTHLWVDFVRALGTLLPPKEPKKRPYFEFANLDERAAYAHTYLFSPREADVEMDLLHDMPAVKVWVNGTPKRITKETATSKIHLNEGWNRILVKAICAKAQVPWGNAYAEPYGVLGLIKWRFAAYIRPVGSKQGYAGEYETKNIAWMTKLTGRNKSQPIVVGDKIFVGSSISDLCCIDKNSGKILWMHTSTYWDAMTAEERAAVKDKAEPLLTKLEKDNAELVALLNANITSNRMDVSARAAIDKKLAERENFTRSVHNALCTGGKKGKLYLNEVSAGNAAPCSDGKQVYWVVQSDGGYVTSSFDLDGKLLWSNFVYQKFADEHGSHRSPVLCEGKLLVSTEGQLFAYDAANGKELWQQPTLTCGHGINGSPILVQFDGKRAIQTAGSLFGLDGKILAAGGYESWGAYVPVVEDGVLYNCTTRGIGDFQAIEIAKEAGAKTKLSWSLDRVTVYGTTIVSGALIFFIASPLYVDGLIYQVHPGGILAVIDTRQKKPVFTRWMDGYNFADHDLYGYTAPPTLAGKNIYLQDEVGYTTILKPGTEGTIVGTNVLQNITSAQWHFAPGRHEPFNAGMYFEGNRIYLHGEEFMYCIAEK